MQYDIHVKQAAPQVIASARRHIVASDLGKVMHATLATVAGSVQPPDAAQGAPFAIYYNEPFRPDDVDVEVGVPIAGDAMLDHSTRVSRRELPGGPVAYTLHVGPYEAIGAAYEALYGWIAQHGHTRLGPPREIYLVGPGPEMRPAEYRTELEVPID